MIPKIVGRPQRGMRRAWVHMLLASVVLLVVAGLAVTMNVSKRPIHATSNDWSMFLGDAAHSGYNSAESAINASTVANLKLQWTYQTGGGNISTEPIVANGNVYWGSWDGNEYATDLNGKLNWLAPIGGQTPDCVPPTIFGVGSTGTIATVTVKGTPTQVLYVGGRDSNANVASVYALNAATGATIWETPLSSETGSFSWSSPVLYNGSVYIGLSSVSDCPLVHAGLLQLDATSGTVQHIFYTVPTDCVGGSIWSSPAIDEVNGIVYITTGNNNFGPPCSPPEKYAQSIVALNASDLSYVSSWQVPKSEYKGDSDFGASPTLFSATFSGSTHQMVGVINKNGTFYAFDRTSLAAGPVWRAHISSKPYNMSSAAWDGVALYVAGQNTTINGQACKSSLRSLDPATGSFNWERCLTDGVIFAPVSIVPGVAFVGEGAHFVAVATATGQVLFNYNTGALIQGGASISNGLVSVGNSSGALYVFGLSTPPIPSPTPGTVLGQDSFQRSDQAEWGTASDGQFWGSAANNAPAFSIKNNTGQILTSGTADNYGATLGLASANADVVLSGSMSAFTSANMGVVVRWQDRTNFYKAQLNGKRLQLAKRVHGAAINLGSVAFVASAGTSYTLRFRVVGTTLSAKAWQTGTPEPTNWMVSATDTSFAFGYCGLQVYGPGGITVGITGFQATAQ